MIKLVPSEIADSFKFIYQSLQLIDSKPIIVGFFERHNESRNNVKGIQWFIGLRDVLDVDLRNMGLLLRLDALTELFYRFISALILSLYSKHDPVIQFVVNYLAKDVDF